MSGFIAGAAVAYGAGVTVGGSLLAGAALGAAAGGMVGSTIMGAKAAEDQADAQREATAAQQRSANVQSAAARVQAVREARIKRASMLAGAGASGVGFASSGVVGAESSIGSQLGANIGQQGVMLGFAEMASQANQRAADASAKGAQWQAIGSLASSAFSGMGGWSKLGMGMTGSGQFGVPAQIVDKSIPFGGR